VSCGSRRRWLVHLSIALGVAISLAAATAPRADDNPTAGGDLTVRLPEGRGERTVRARAFDGGEGRAEYLAAGDVAELLRATSYWRSETRKLLLRMGDRRLTVTVDNPFAVLDGETTRLPAAPRYDEGQVWLPLVVFDLLAQAGALPQSQWDPAARVLALGSDTETDRDQALARRMNRGAADSLGGSTPNRPALVVLDPGHGGEDTGCVSKGGLQEKHLTLELATRIRRHLEREAGCRSVLVRERDERVEVPRRVEIANSSRGDLFVSLHFDLTGGSARHVHLAVRPGSGQVLFEDLARMTPGAVAASSGPENLDLVPWSTASTPFGVESYRMAQQIASEIEAEVTGMSASVEERPVWNLEGAEMPAVVIEVGTPPGGAEGADRGELLEDLATAVARGLARYWRGGRSS
jgi:N-acetylmuramoyl-L-alanine amidase